MAPITTVSQPLAPVNLRSTANFAVLAGSLVSNIPTSAVTGDVGLSPAAGSGITGFGPTEATGIIYTVDATGPAGSVTDASRLTAAQGDLTIAYNEARDRTPVPTGTFLNPGAGNIGGLTLVPGLYKFTGTLLITGSDVTLTGSATDVWIFQIAADLNVGNGIQVILAGYAQAANIFWQVGTSATLGTTSVLKGTIMADQSISLNTGARLDGRALASIAAVTLSSNAITRPATVGLVHRSGPQAFPILRMRPNHSFEFMAPSSGRMTLRIMNMFGREIAIPFNGKVEAGRPNLVSFNTSRWAKGLYLSKLEYNGMIKVEKMLLVY